mgnify:CR=1 FL=1
MKKLLLTFLGLFALLLSSEASHMAGGDIQYKYIGDSTGVANQYQIIARLYRDAQGITMPTSINVSVCSSCYATANVTCPLVGGGPGSVAPTLFDCVDPSPTNGTVVIEVYIYKGITILAGLCSDWKFAYNTCCRNGAVGNITAASGQGFYIEAKLNNFLGNNTSPFFVSEPVRAFCVGQTFNWKQSSIEPDGDSLRYTIVAVRENTSNCTFANIPYAGGFTALQPISTTPPNSLSMDPSTGIITFKPSTQEVDVMAVVVEEYRFDSTYYQWVKIGESNRDMQITVSPNCSFIAQQGVLLDYNAPGFSQDPITGLPTVEYDCLDSAIVLQFATKLDCSSISPDGTDFRLTAPNGQPIPVKELVAFCDVNNETDEMIVKLHKPLAFNGDYYLYSKMGNDGTTLLNKCGFQMSEFDTIVLRVSGCFVTVIDMKNVSVIDDDYPKIEWLLDTVGTPTAPFPKYLVDEYKVYRSDGAAQPYNLIYTLKDYKQMKFNDKSIGWSDVDARSYKYKVDVVVNSFAVGLTRDVHSIWLRTADGAPIFDPAEKIDLVWNSYNGWPSPEYTVFLGKKDANGLWVETAHVPTGSMVNPTFDTTYFMENEGLVPGDYRVCVRADYPGGSGPYKAWSNCLPFTIYDPPIPPVDTPVTIVIPNIITPNGDGTNDMFDIKNIETWSTTRSVQIFNRWGNLVFEDGSYVNGLGNAWEGKDQSGKKLPDGVYFYMIEVYDQPSETRKNYNGQVTIMGTAF